MRVGVVLVLFLMLLAGGGHDAAETPLHRSNLQAEVMTVHAEELPQLLEMQGMIHAVDDAVLSSRAMGPVVREYVKVGDRVTKGQALLEIEERMSSGQLAQAQGALAQGQAALALAQRNHQRFQSLFEKQACSQLEYDMALMQYEQAKGAVEQAEGAVTVASSIADESIVRAPFDAVVVEKMASTGDLVAPGRPLIRVQSSSGREIWLTVRAAEVRYFELGDSVQVVPNSLQNYSSLTAMITEIAPSGDPATQTFLVKAKLIDSSVPAGVGVTAYVDGEIRTTMLIPRTAIYHSGGLELVAVVDSADIARTRAVTLGRARGTGVEILSGLEAGQRIVAHREGPIAEGTKIQDVTE